MTTGRFLRYAVSLGGGNADAWVCTPGATMTYFKFTFATSFTTNNINIVLGGNSVGVAYLQLAAELYTNDWSVFIDPVQTLIEGNLQMVNGTIQSNDVLLNGTSLITTLDTKSDITYVDNKVASLVNSAPSTLDTLNELATALGNDPNFATTMTNTLALKAPKANPTFTGTVLGIDKTMVGLSNVDNTTDLNKQISTLTQVALNGKASLAGATFIGDISSYN